MGYPDNFSSAAFAEYWGDEPRSRRSELDDEIPARDARTVDGQFVRSQAAVKALLAKECSDIAESL